MSARKVIVTAALTGGLHGKAQVPALPETPEEIAREAIACSREGAAIVHIHARDPGGNPTGDPGVYRDIHERIRRHSDMILQDTTGGGPNLSLEERIQGALEAGPEMASLNMGTLVRIHAPGALKNTVFKNTRDDIEAFARAFRQRGIKPEMEAYSHAMLAEVENLIEKGLVEPPYWVNLVMGMRYMGAEPARPQNLISLIGMLPPQSLFNVCAIGRDELILTTLSILLGGNVRVGLEDNIYYRKGEPAESNAQLVGRTVRILRELEMEPASPDEARAILGLAGARGCP